MLNDKELINWWYKTVKKLYAWRSKHKKRFFDLWDKSHLRKTDKKT